MLPARPHAGSIGRWIPQKRPERRDKTPGLGPLHHGDIGPGAALQRSTLGAQTVGNMIGI